MGRKRTIIGDSLADLLPDWELYLRAAGKSPRTVAIYLDAARELVDALGPDVTPAEVTHRTVQRFLADMAGRTHKYNPAKTVSPSYVNQRYRSLFQLFKWLTEVEEEISESPFKKVTPPQIPEKLVPVVPDDETRKLLQACNGNRFYDRRDMALIRLLIDTGARRTEILNLTLDDIEFRPTQVYVVGKGNRPRIIPFGARTSEALRRYLRARARHPLAGTTNALWLGNQGALRKEGMRSLLVKRTSMAGIPHINPHRLRHSLAHNWLASGGNEGDLMGIMNWKSRAMCDHYGKSAADERAQEAHRRKALGDRF